MRAARAVRLSLALSVIAMVTGVALAAHFGASHPHATGYSYLIEGVVTAPILFAITWLLVARRPDHPITWVFAASTGFSSLQLLAGTYGHEALLGHPLPGGEAALFVSSVSQGVAVTITLLLFNLFPTGAPASPRWRFTIWLAFGAIGWTLVGPLLGPNPYGDREHLPEFATIPGLLHASTPPVLRTVLEGVGAGIGIALLVATLAHLVVRFRRSRGVERVQLRWFTYSVVGAILFIALPWDLLLEAVLGVRLPDWFAWALGPAIAWTGMALAVVRYRLYDIDRIVSRTVSYALVSALLLGAYLGAVVVLQSLLRPVTGGGDLGVALATLAVAAAARPLLRRVQAVVDRRFNRRTRDARQALERFADRLRDEVDLASVHADLRATAREVVEPATTSIWLPPPMLDTTSERAAY